MTQTLGPACIAYAGPVSSSRRLGLLRQKACWNSLPTWGTTTRSRVDVTDQCREPEVRIILAASPVANFGFKAALES
jgi:hypothetical protein